MALQRKLADSNIIPALGVISPPPIHVDSPHFEGSLATLFRCVRDHKVDLLDVPLLPICEAYFTYLLAATLDDLDEAAAALAVLAYLLERKAWALLPTPEPEPDAAEPMEMLPPCAHEYAVAIELLKTYHDDRAKVFFRAPEVGPNLYELPYTLGDVKPDDLARAFARMIAKATPHGPETVGRARRSLSDTMIVVLGALEVDWKGIEDLITQPFSREDAVYFFLALLELVRLGQARVRCHPDQRGGTVDDDAVLTPSRRVAKDGPSTPASPPVGMTTDEEESNFIVQFCRGRK